MNIDNFIIIKSEINANCSYLFRIHFNYEINMNENNSEHILRPFQCHKNIE